jgi:hypothetical protein
MNLQQIGYFHELDADAKEQAILALRSPVPRDHEELVLHYLERGEPIAVSPMIDTDVMVGDNVSLGEVIIRSDGTFAWPSTLAYFVKTYHLELPENFVSHVIQRNGVPDAIDPSTHSACLEGQVEL